MPRLLAGGSVFVPSLSLTCHTRLARHTLLARPERSETSRQRAGSANNRHQRVVQYCIKADMAVESGQQEAAPASAERPQVAVVTTLGCTFCKRAKDALRRESIAFEEIELSRDLDLLRSIQQATGLRTVPQVLFCTSYVQARCKLMKSTLQCSRMPRQYTMIYDAIVMKGCKERMVHVTGICWWQACGRRN